MLYADITGWGKCVPPAVLSNEDLTTFMDTSDEWIQTRTGIRERRWVEDGMANSDLALPACQQAIRMAGIQAKDIDAIIVGTVTSDYNFPGMAPIIR